MPRTWNCDDLTGQRFGRLTVLKYAGQKQYGGQRQRFWLVRCDCGHEYEIWHSNLTKVVRMCKRCADAAFHAARRLHGMSKSKEYAAWRAMNRRTSGVCRSWKDSFAQFFADMGSRPQGWVWLRRIDKSLPYGPGNCVWESAAGRKGAKVFSCGGKSLTMRQWAKALGITRQAVHARLQGQSPEQALRVGPRQGRRIAR